MRGITTSQPRTRSPSPTRRDIHGFSRQTKDLCWSVGKQVKGRDPKRWRFDAAGNLLCRGLRNCQGPLCVEFDHIHPISKGGTGDLSNCQILQSRANKSKGNKLPPPRGQELRRISDLTWRDLSNEDLDAIELAVYGDVYRDGKLYRGLPSKARKEERKDKGRMCLIM
mmetsp:Transcript_258/g.642  ORF Transcript_258/g.642 Transcript_258/m.642 type:complete len:168 (-) Transcript_258:316-819(-)|eukprot:CAMPEP_0113971174 /NCGR_PEP_ID=MMETSP0011_2-20120614/12008_1 /TAXON_ID=101924 /ORGANISM="Rhodosorus marinus" /LENGTH=167 /DNA_ID=CAMNT_0000986477 /DNA_START=472 /DNA_END=975 /DNA_ORIENTATION=- /assembly_acc=CAM_ASM_000156